MKRRKLTVLLVTICLLTAGVIFSVETYSNVFIELEALAEDTPKEGRITCAKYQYNCFDYCPKCGEMIEASLSVNGPSLGVTGWCSECIRKWRQEHNGEGNEQ